MFRGLPLNLDILYQRAKKLNILSNYVDTLSIPRFTDAIDWGWFAFLTKPISYAINWFYNIVGNFGVAIIAFTILMRLIFSHWLMLHLNRWPK